MPQVNITPETYEKLKEMAEKKGCTPDAMMQSLIVERAMTPAMTDEQWKDEWASIRRDVQASLPAGITDEEIEADIETARQEVWEERMRARSR